MPTTLVLSLGMVVLSALIAAIPAPRPQVSAASVLASVHEAQLRRMASVTVRPECPATVPRDALPAVAVVQAYVAPDGHVLAVEPLDIPDPAIGQAIAPAVMKWRFFIPREDLPERFVTTAKLTFYFASGPGGCTVLHPSEAPSYRDWPSGRVPGARGTGQVEAARKKGH